MNDWEKRVRAVARQQLHRTLSYIVGDELRRAASRVVEERCAEGCGMVGFFHACPFDNDEDDEDVYQEALRYLDDEYVRDIFLESTKIRCINPKLIKFDKTLARLKKKWGNREYRDSVDDGGPAFMRSMNAPALYLGEFYSDAEAVDLARWRVDQR